MRGHRVDGMDAGRYILRRMATDVASAAMDARVVFCRGGCGRSFSGHYHARCRREFPDDVWWVVVLKSAPVTLILLFVILMSLMSRNGRDRLRRVMVSDRGMWVVSAIAGLAFVAVGGLWGAAAGSHRFLPL